MPDTDKFDCHEPSEEVNRDYIPQAGIRKVDIYFDLTNDEIAWMREQQRMNINFAILEGDELYGCEDCPGIKEYTTDDGDTGRYWAINSGEFQTFPSTCFLRRYITKDDTEPFCFDDYAPLL